MDGTGAAAGQPREAAAVRASPASFPSIAILALDEGADAPPAPPSAGRTRSQRRPPASAGPRRSSRNIFFGDGLPGLVPGADADGEDSASEGGRRANDLGSLRSSALAVAGAPRRPHSAASAPAPRVSYADPPSARKSRRAHAYRQSPALPPDLLATADEAAAAGPARRRRFWPWSRRGAWKAPPPAADAPPASLSGMDPDPSESGRATPSFSDAGSRSSVASPPALSLSMDPECQRERMLEKSFRVKLTITMAWEQFMREFAVHTLFPLSLPPFLLAHGPASLRQRHFIGLYWMTPAIWMSFSTPFLACIAFFGLLTSEERNAKAVEFALFFTTVIVRAVMVAVKYGFRPRSVYRQSLKGALPIEYCRSEELLFGWLPLRAPTARSQIEETCARVRVDPDLPLVFRNPAPEVRRALRLALFAYPDMVSLIQPVPRVRDGKACGNATRVPLHLWLLQLLLESSEDEKRRFRERYRVARTALSSLKHAVYASVSTVTRVVFTFLQISLPYFIQETVDQSLEQEGWALKFLSICMIMGGFFVMFFFIVPLALVAVTQARRRLRWLRAAGEVFCLEYFGEDELEAGLGMPAPAGHRRHGAASLQLDFLAQSNILAWARLRQVVCHIGWRFALRLAIFLSMLAASLAGLLLFVLYASLVPAASRSAPQWFYVLTLVDLGFFGSCLVVCCSYGSRTNALVFQHRFFLMHLNMRLEEAAQSAARALAPLAALAGGPGGGSGGSTPVSARRVSAALSRFRAAVPKAVSTACPLCREPLAHCPCLRHIALCEKHIQRDHRLHPETVIGMRADVNLLRVVASTTISAFILTFTRVRGLGLGRSLASTFT